LFEAHAAQWRRFISHSASEFTFHAFRPHELRNLLTAELSK